MSDFEGYHISNETSGNRSIESRNSASRLQAQNWRLCDQLDRMEGEMETLKAELSAERAKVAKLTLQTLGLSTDEDNDEVPTPPLDQTSSAPSSTSSPIVEQHQRLLHLTDGLLGIVLNKIDSGDTIYLPSGGGGGGDDAPVMAPYSYHRR